ncbi:fused response regulator/phosphatase [Mucilaginibacter mali]|uniref:Fused response regulator/phosphatase n=1 Tax=Mucilaginibacter mali TaxID=2740462 RepID=A0A7D4UIZ5_9SPHI|nr:fused response regulator/phosphatase [Mucilaginibacter mali]QKJ28302.1 fused response regulator/phosphatase [Mucilaginibacter mali]
MPASHKILLVDDNPLVLEMMGRALSREGFICMKANSAMQAMELLEKDVPDIILSDYDMPEMNGFQFRQQLMGNKKFKHIPFMFLTSMNNAELMLEGMNMDAIDYIVKDVPVPVIVSKITNVLNTIREQHERSISELSRAAVALNLNSVPQKVPVLHGFGIDFWHKPYQNYPGGDFIDFIQIDERYTFIVLGDVMGKKWGAWFFSFGFLSYVRSAVRLCIFDGDLSTKSIMQKINSVVHHDPVVSEVLSTLSLVMVDTELSQMSYSGAGDLPLLYYNYAGDKTSRIQSEGLLLGLRQDGDFDEFMLKLNPGDQILMLTDGMIDEETAGRKRSDYSNFEQAITAFLGKPDTFNQIRNSDFLNKKAQEQIDDCSLIFLQKEIN